MKLKKLIILILSIFSLQIASAQNQEVRGRVVDESNNGIGGVTILNAANNRAITATSDNGNFAISVAPNTTLLFKAVGFAQRRITVRANQTSLKRTDEFHPRSSGRSRSAWICGTQKRNFYRILLFTWRKRLA
ncbi:carboxypeptidase-like regulatory domain-containing protein [Sphingobacterium daejeonense]|uniref:carboxypeptidase-like regulatory domain-containing protein n=1 Tax=Sphingobacterium daejeonense TaxID=371142 RepID=UPI001E50647F|nr:carboxypeptidase-like regulatory domain-containing protein [Sphingobacterium daejeonense]